MGASGVETMAPEARAGPRGGLIEGHGDAEGRGSLRPRPLPQDGQSRLRRSQPHTRQNHKQVCRLPRRGRSRQGKGSTKGVRGRGGEQHSQRRPGARRSGHLRVRGQRPREHQQR